MKKMIKSLSLSLLCGCLSAISIFSQNVKIKIVSDVDSLPLPQATIQVIAADSTHRTIYTTDDKGLFDKKIPVDSFAILVSYVGHEELVLSIKNSDRKDMNLGTVRLPISLKTSLDEVTVTTQPVVESIAKTIVFPTSQQLKSSTSGISLLQQLQLPGLFVNPVMQEVKIAGTSGVIYRINGINASLAEVVALKASQIQKVEYSQTPSIRELDSNSGVINIILKKENVGTHIYTNGLGAFTTGFLNGNATLKTVFGKSELSLDYIVNWRDYSERWSDEHETYKFPTHLLNYSKRGRNAPFGYLSQNINLTYTYNDIKNTFVLKFLNSLYNSHDRNYIDIFQNSSKDPLFFRDIHAQFKNYTPSLDLYYIRKIDDKRGVEVNVVGTWMNSDYHRDLVDSYADGNKSSVNNTTDGDRKSVIGEGFFYNNINRVNYKLGVKGSYNHTRNVYSLSNVNQITQFNLYPYASIEGKIAHIAYSLGSGMQILSTDHHPRSKTYYMNLSTLSLFYDKKKSWNIRNVIRYAPSFPTLSHLNNIDQRQDSLMIIRGNPMLRPSQTLSDRFNFSYQPKNNFRTVLSLNASKTYDPIRNSYFYDPTSKSFVSQRNNQSYETQFGAALDVSLSSLLKIFNLSGGVALNNYYSKGIDYSHSLNDFYWYIFCNAQIKNFSFDIGYRQPSKDLIGEAIYLNENYSVVGASYKKDHFSLMAGIMYPLSSGTKYGTQLLSSAVSSTKNIYIRDNANMVYVGFSYNFSWGKPLFGVNKNLRNADWDNGITKMQDN